MSSHNNSSPAVNDPRQPSTANPYVAPMVRPEDLPVDYSGFIAVIFAIVGLMFRYKLCSWLAIIFCAQSLSNMRNFENDLKQISMAMITGAGEKAEFKFFLPDSIAIHLGGHEKYVK
uniref:Protein Asterix n=1 Tax=Vitis vinifera TaxID=29760 RepID=A5B7C7_VITVI|nr:hypothetical protein VITISV_006224 [Vitis vinifera]